MEVPKQYEDDYTDLEFDVTRHAEAFGAFAALGIEKKSVKPALKARDLIRYHVPKGKFIIGVTDDPKAQQESLKGDHCIAFAVIDLAESAGEARAVCDGVARYFKRHFPGRCMNTADDASMSEEPQGNYVTIAFFEPLD